MKLFNFCKVTFLTLTIGAAALSAQAQGIPKILSLSSQIKWFGVMLQQVLKRPFCMVTQISPGCMWSGIYFLLGS